MFQGNDIEDASNALDELVSLNAPLDKVELEFLRLVISNLSPSADTHGREKAEALALYLYEHPDRLSRALVDPSIKIDDQIFRMVRAYEAKHAETMRALKKILENELKNFNSYKRNTNGRFYHTLLRGRWDHLAYEFAKNIAKELGAGVRRCAADNIKRVGDLKAILTNLRPNDVFLIDNVGNLTDDVVECLFCSMEHFECDLIIGVGEWARSVKIAVSPFTVVACSSSSSGISICDGFEQVLNASDAIPRKDS